MTKPTPSPSSSLVCLPRWATQRSPERETFGGQVAAAAASFNQPLMPWQRLVADVGCEYLPGTKIPAYREVIVTIPRQNGKTTLTLSFEVQRAIGWGAPQKIAYTAQTGKDAREKLLNDQAPILQASTAPIAAAIARVMRGVGNEAILWKSGSRIFVLNSGEDAGHGKVIDLGVIDESFADEDDRREQAMLPAMLTRPSAQILNISTAGTERSPFLRRKVDAGRAAVADDIRQGIAYFEWSAPDDADIDDPATWRACMPALGFTITEEVVVHARQTMSEGDFRRAMLNQWTISDERVIPAALWEQAKDPRTAPDGRFALGFDVNPERTSASIVVADEQMRAELVEHTDGLATVVDRIAEIAERWSMPIVVDGQSPAGSFINELKARHLNVRTYSTREVAAACAVLYDGIADGKVKIRPSEALDTAAAAARKRQVNDSWIWGRRDSSEDVSPLIALTLAIEHASSGINHVEAWAEWD